MCVCLTGERKEDEREKMVILAEVAVAVVPRGGGKCTCSTETGDLNLTRFLD
jgi:hypothetical protein